MKIRDRIKTLRRVQASELKPNPRNWRLHPDRQQEALRGLLAEIGYIDALLARELPDGTLELIDGHLRAETTPHEQVPVLVVDLSEEESTLALATLDPLSALAEPDHAQLDGLLAETRTENSAVRQMLDDLEKPTDQSVESPLPRDTLVPDSFQVVVDCADERQQRDLYERLTTEGWNCKVFTL